MKQLHAEGPTNKSSLQVREFPDVCVCDSYQYLNGRDASFEMLMEKNKAFLEDWRHDPRPMVTRMKAENPTARMRYDLILVDFTNGLSFAFENTGQPGTLWDKTVDGPLTREDGLKAVKMGLGQIMLCQTASPFAKGVSAVVDFLNGANQTRTTSTSSGG